MTQEQNQSQSAAPVPSDKMDFETGTEDTVSTKVGTVGWPEGAENEEGTGPGSDEPMRPQPEPTPEPTPQPQPTEPPNQPTS